MKKSVGIWIRVSTEDQAKGESPQNHEYRCRLFSEAREWDVKEVYHLEGVSGKSVINHPEAKRMLADVAKGHITGLVFSKLSRLGRNTKEMLELADYFRHHNASLISLGDNLDTASPSGRFFYTLLAAFGEMEREEIVSRVKGSIPARAHMGKSLGGEAPFGYKWVNNKLELDEKEAPIRKLMFELFAKHKRKMTVATILNEKGYRTRRGEEFGSTSVGRYLSDPIAKGLRRMNYMESSSNRKHAKLKPQDEWIFGEAPAIVSEELWDTCHEILVSLNHGKTKTRRPGIHLFSGVIMCECGSKMYMRSNSPRYVCKDYKNCKNQIMPDDLEAIYREQVRNLLYSQSEFQKHLGEEQNRANDYHREIKGHRDRIAELRTQIQNLLSLFHEGQIKKDAFASYHDPLYTELQQREQSLAEVQSKIDLLGMDTLNNEQVIQDARDLYSLWETFSPEDKRTIIESITEVITIGKEDIEIKLNAIPTLYKGNVPTEPSIPGSIQLLTIAAPNNSSKLVQLSTNSLRVVS